MHNVVQHYYRDATPGLQFFNRGDRARTVKNGIVLASYTYENETYTIGTTHFTWTPDGATPNTEQVTDMDALLAYITKKEPHIMCGDFNIPRNQNPLYQKLVELYTDAIPHSYASSLDATLHRHGASPDKKQLFESFMVDYVFTQPPYTAHDVRLVFGVSDHAAVVATLDMLSGQE
jgi:endonuclease/exonuclease/phosphatase family metal-dependent hydrolase